MTGEAPAGRPIRRRLDAATRRETILTAAIQAFERGGYDQVRVADIAAKVGVTEPVVFQNFSTKAELFAAVLDRTADDFARHLTALADDEDDVPALLARILTPERLDRLHSRETSAPCSPTAQPAQTIASNSERGKPSPGWPKPSLGYWPEDRRTGLSATTPNRSRSLGTYCH